MFCKLECSWVRLFVENFYNWKIIQLHLIKKHFWGYVKFHRNLDISKSALKQVPWFYQEIITWSDKYFPSLVGISSLTASVSLVEE